AVVEAFLLEEEMRFKQRYYGLLIVKAACWFGAAVAVMLIIKLLI
ncbi:anti-sigma factor, partial [Bacillus vallismortis]|nr:anti-sigma factor [Bacillus vallismortis]